jgi:putative endonuclease
MPADHRTALAVSGELLAAEHLRRRGYDVVAQNARTRFGEIDLVAHGHRTLVFVEVKTRRSGGNAGTALEAISHRKTKQVRRLAAAWLNDTPGRPNADEIRFDAVGVTVGRRGELISLDHVEGAF